jgi:hypothetical protein
MHEATLIKDSRFPGCKRCKSSARFMLARAADAKLVLPFRSTEFLQEWTDLLPAKTERLK